MNYSYWIGRDHANVLYRTCDNEEYAYYFCGREPHSWYLAGWFQVAEDTRRYMPVDLVTIYDSCFLNAPEYRLAVLQELS